MNISKISAVLMIAAFAVTLGGAIFVHGNYLAAWFAFSGAWFAFLCAIKS